MAQVPYTQVPGALPSALPDNYNRVQSTPQDFGSQVGAAIGQVGGAFDQASADANQLTMMRQNLVNQTASDDATNNLMAAQQKLMYGDPNDPTAAPGFMTLQGQDAVIAAPKVQQQMEALQSSIGDTLTNPIQKVAYEQDSRRLNMMAISNLNLKANTEQQRYQLETAKATITNAYTNAGSTPDDLGNLQANATKIINTTNALAAAGGYSPEMKQATLQQNLQGLFVGVARARAAGGDAAGAQALLDANRNNISPDVYSAMTDELKPKLDEATGASLATGALNGYGTGKVGGISPTADTGSIFGSMIQMESGGRQTDASGAPLSSGASPGDSPVGVAQIKPSTAEMVAKANGIPFDANRLATDPAYNRALGQDYFNQMMSRYGGNKTLAVAAYNAGPANVDGWIKANGDPRTGAVSDTQFVQSIPFAETRNYVSRVAASTGGQLTAQPTQLADATGTGTASDAGGVLPPTVDQALGRPSAPLYTPRPDFEGAASRVVANGQEMGASNQAIAYGLTQIQKQKTSWEAQNSANVAGLTTQANNLMASYENGDNSQAVPVMQIRSLLPQEQAQTVIDKLMVARQDGQAFLAVQYGSPADIANAVQTVATSDPTDDNDRVAQRSDDAKRLQGLINARNEKLNKDPAAYSAGNPALAPLAAAVQANPNDPQALQSYNTALLADQTRMGVASPRLLSNDQVSSIVSTINKTDPATGDVGATLDQIAAKFGPTWPQAFGELVKHGGLDAQYQTIAAMDQPSQVGARADFQRALQVKLPGLMTSANSGNATNTKTIDQNIVTDPTMTSFQATIRGQSAGAQLFQNVNDSVKRLAYYYAGQGQDPGTAVQNASKAILGEKYDFTGGTYRVPTGTYPAVESAIVNTFGALKASDLKPLPTAPGLTAADSQNSALASAKMGTWINNADDSGIVLMHNTRLGLTPVMLATGKPVTLLFSDANKLSAALPQPVEQAAHY